MTALRQQAHEMLDMMPENIILNLIQLMQAEQEKKEARQKEWQELERQEREIKAFGERMAKKYGLKANADEIQESIDRIKGSLSSMSESDKNKSVKEWREERLREKYAEYFD